MNVVALDELLTVGGEKGDKLSLVDTLEDTKAEDPVTAFETEETKFILSRAINQLPEREKIVITLYYYEGLTLAEIGRVLGVTESRICQMHTKAVIQLRAKMAEASRPNRPAGHRGPGLGGPPGWRDGCLRPCVRSGTRPPGRS